MIDLLKNPWAWYIAGPLIGLMVPLLLIFGNKCLGISSSFRHICASCFPCNLPFFNYNWKKEVWNLFFVAGIFIGGFIAWHFFNSNQPIEISPVLTAEFKTYGIKNYDHLVPQDLMNWGNLLTLKGFFLIVVGGFLVGFGTRYAGGCTSGHAIMGLANLQIPSLIATICFMLGGFIMANFILPFILQL